MKYILLALLLLGLPYYSFSQEEGSQDLQKYYVGLVFKRQTNA